VDVSDQRLEVVKLLERSDEPLSPAVIAAALGRPSGATRELLSKMHRDGQVSTRGRGRYVAASDSDTDVTDNEANVTDDARDVTDNAISRLHKRNTLRAFSLQDGGMVDYQTVRARKGYLETDAG
jgi:predicted transcriptional regulator